MTAIQTKTCYDCCGQGVVPFRPGVRNSFPRDRCPSCGGTGVVPLPPLSLNEVKGLPLGTAIRWQCHEKSHCECNRAVTSDRIDSEDDRDFFWTATLSGRIKVWKSDE